MNTYRLDRINAPQYTNVQLRQFAKTKWVCNVLFVQASSEAEARELAARPRPTYGKPVSESNTIDVPYAWCYDNETHIWADPAASSCTLVSTNDATEPKLLTSQWGEVPREPKES